MNLGDAAGAEPSESSKLFAVTQWSVVLRAKDDSIAALDSLFNRYRKPMILYLLGRRHPIDRAEDLVQGFCAHLLRRDFLANVAPQKGKFRTFLLTSLDNYIRDKISEERALKRGAGNIPVSLDEIDSDGELLHSPKSPAPSADLEYDKAWAQTILRHSLRHLERECSVQGHANLYRAIEPVMHDDETSSSYRDIAARLGMTEGSVKVAAHRVRKRLRSLIRDELMQTVSNEVEFKEELKYLISLLSQPQI